MSNSVQVLWNHYATWFEDLSPTPKWCSRTASAKVLVGDASGDASHAHEPLPWEIPANGKRTTGVEPATFGLGSRRSTN